MAAKIKAHVVRGFFPTGEHGSLLFVEEKKRFRSVVDAVEVEPMESGDGWALFLHPADSIRSMVMESNCASCLRCKSGRECSFVSDSMHCLSGIPFLFEIKNEEGELLHGGDHDAFEARKRALMIESVRGKYGEVYNVVNTYAKAADNLRRGDVVGAVFEVLDKVIGGAPVHSSPAFPAHIADALRELSVSWPYTSEDVRAAFKEAALRRHPDRGGSEEAMRRAVEARDTLLRAI